MTSLNISLKFLFFDEKKKIYRHHELKDLLLSYDIFPTITEIDLWLPKVKLENFELNSLYIVFTSPNCTDSIYLKNLLDNVPLEFIVFMYTNDIYLPKRTGPLFLEFNPFDLDYLVQKIAKYYSEEILTILKSDLKIGWYIQKYLKKLKTEIPGVSNVLLSTSNGVVSSFVGDPGQRLDLLSAMATAIVSVADRQGDESETGKLETLISSCETGTILLIYCSSSHTLLLSFSKNVKPLEIFTKYFEKIKEIRNCVALNLKIIHKLWEEAIIQKESGNIPLALEKMLHLEKLITDWKDDRKLFSLCLEIGETYSLIAEFDKTFDYYKKSFYLSQRRYEIEDTIQRITELVTKFTGTAIIEKLIYEFLMKLYTKEKDEGTKDFYKKQLEYLDKNK